MRRWFLILLTGGVLVVAGAASALADAVYHSHHYALSSVNGAPLRSGFVENIHVNGPNIAAHEPGFVENINRSGAPLTEKSGYR